MVVDIQNNFVTEVVKKLRIRGGEKLKLSSDFRFRLWFLVYVRKHVELLLVQDTVGCNNEFCIVVVGSLLHKNQKMEKSRSLTKPASGAIFVDSFYCLNFVLGVQVL